MNDIKSLRLSEKHHGYTLLTGATGLLGRYLTKDLLLASKRLVLLIRPTEKLTAQERVEDLLQFWERELETVLPRPIVVVGDVTQSDFGISENDLEWLTSNCDQIIHSAASLNFVGSDRAGEPWRTNYEGSRNFVQLAKKIGVTDWHYVSTAYVCGKREGNILEDDLDYGQEFRNDYEESKLAAELMVREQAENFAKLTVYRPAVIVGDSKTGFTSSYHGLFLYLRLIATLVPQQPRDENGIIQTPITLPIKGDEPRNLVTVDWVSEVMCRIINSSQAHGKTFHISPDTFATARQVIDYCYDYFNSAGVQYSGGSEINEEELGNFAETFFANSSIYESYQTDDPSFDRTNLVEFAGDIPCPSIDRELIFKFIQFGEKDRWGKRRPKQPSVPVWINEYLEKLTKFSVSEPDDHTHIGIDIHGPGGGQWQIVINGDCSTILRGLPLEPSMVLTLDSRQLFSDETKSKDEEDFLFRVLSRSLSGSSLPFPTLNQA